MKDKAINSKTFEKNLKIAGRLPENSCDSFIVTKKNRRPKNTRCFIQSVVMSVSDLEF